MQKPFVQVGDCFPRISFSSENLLLIPLKESKTKKNGRTAIIGPSYSIQLDYRQRVKECEPLLPYSTGLLKWFSNFDRVYLQYFPFTCRGLKEAGQDLSTFINEEVYSPSSYQNYILLIGHSKSGLCFPNAFQWFSEQVQRVTHVCSITTPYQGCSTADQEAYTADMNSFEKTVYSWIFNNHPVDKDMIPGSDFLKNIFLPPPFAKHLNFVSSFRGTFTFHAAPDPFLFWLDKRKHVGGGGLISEKSQTLYPETDILLHCSDAASMGQALEQLKGHLFL